MLIAIAGKIQVGQFAVGVKQKSSRFFVSVVGAIILVIGLYLIIKKNIPASKETEKPIFMAPVKLSIVYPKDGDTIGNCEVIVRGLYPDSITNDLWILLMSGDNRYYPQSDFSTAINKQNGEVVCI